MWELSSWRRVSLSELQVRTWTLVIRLQTKVRVKPFHAKSSFYNLAKRRSCVCVGLCACSCWQRRRVFHVYFSGAGFIFIIVVLWQVHSVFRESLLRSAAVGGLEIRSGFFCCCDVNDIKMCLCVCMCENVCLCLWALLHGCCTWGLMHSECVKCVGEKAIDCLEKHGFYWATESESQWEAGREKAGERVFVCLFIITSNIQPYTFI